VKEWCGMSRPTPVQNNVKGSMNNVRTPGVYGDPNKPKISTEGPQCYKCRGHEHFTTVCPTKEKKIIHAFELNTEVAPKSSNEDQDTVEEDSGEMEEERVQAVDLPIYVVHKMLSNHATPTTQVEDDWRRTNIFHTKVAHKSKALNAIIDNDSGLNVISTEAVDKLRLQKEKHPTPYNVSWITDNHPVMIQHRCLIQFFLSSHFEDEVWCDVLPMTVCHLLLGKPWLFDRKVNHNGYDNTYSLKVKNKKLVLEPQPIREFQQNSTMILSLQKFQQALLETPVMFILVCKAVVGRMQ